MTEIKRTMGLLVSLLLIACIGLVVLRGPLIDNQMEGFLPGLSKRCGIQLGGCAAISGTRCMNGGCDSSEPPPLLANKLPVYP